MILNLTKFKSRDTNDIVIGLKIPFNPPNFSNCSALSGGRVGAVGRGSIG